MIKRAVQSILPQNAINMVRGLRDGAGLKIAKTLDFDPRPLKAVSALDLREIWHDQEIQYRWQAASSDIKKVLDDKAFSGGVNIGDRRAIFYLVQALKPQNVLEIGTHIGASTAYFAKALQMIESDAANDGEHRCALSSVDMLDVNAPNAPWSKLGLERSPQDVIDALGCQDFVTFTSSSAQTFMAQIAEQHKQVEQGTQFDFIFLDGDHSAKGVYNEIHYALKILKPGGMILMHDYFSHARPLFPDGNVIPGPSMAVDRISRENPGEISVLSLGELPWPTKQGTQVTSLAILTKIGWSV